MTEIENSFEVRFEVAVERSEFIQQVTVGGWIFFKTKFCSFKFISKIWLT